jgi:hypothetical protein
MEDEGDNDFTFSLSKGLKINMTSFPPFPKEGR